MQTKNSRNLVRPGEKCVSFFEANQEVSRRKAGKIVLLVIGVAARWHHEISITLDSSSFKVVENGNRISQTHSIFIPRV